MNWITTIVSAFTSLATLAKGRLAELIVIGAFVVVITYMYQDNQSLKETAKIQETLCNDRVVAIRTDADKRVATQAELFQTQINEFILRKNTENDSIYTVLYNRVRQNNIKVNSINNQLDVIKDESINN